MLWLTAIRVPSLGTNLIRSTSKSVRIRLLRRTRGLSQQALAEAAGVTFQQIQKYENGTNRVSASMLTRIAKCFGVPVAVLFGETEPEGIQEHFKNLSVPGAIELLDDYAALSAGTRASLARYVSTLRQRPA